MKFTVVWSPEAEAELTEIWMASETRNSVASAADQIDDLLKQNPQICGESREDNVRILFIAPLAVEFEVVAEDRSVYVRGVWAFKNRLA